MYCIDPVLSTSTHCYYYVYVNCIDLLYTRLVDRERGKDNAQTSDMRYVNDTIIRTFDIVVTLAITKT